MYALLMVRLCNHVASLVLILHWKKSHKDYKIMEKQKGTDQITGMTLTPRSFIS